MVGTVPALIFGSLIGFTHSGVHCMIRSEAIRRRTAVPSRLSALVDISLSILAQKASRFASELRRTSTLSFVQRFPIGYANLPSEISPRLTIGSKFLSATALRMLAHGLDRTADSFSMSSLQSTIADSKAISPWLVYLELSEAL